MAKITLTNSFHNTQAKCVPIPIKSGRFSGFYKISRKTAMRLRRELCGIRDCVCGGIFGERDGYHVEVINEDYDRNYIIQFNDNEKL